MTSTIWATIAIVLFIMFIFQFGIFGFQLLKVCKEFVLTILADEQWKRVEDIVAATSGAISPRGIQMVLQHLVEDGLVQSTQKEKDGPVFYRRFYADGTWN